MSLSKATTPLDSVLNVNTTDKYFIEYDGFLSNHLSHGIIALHRLEAASERIERFVKWYTPKLIGQNGDKVDSRDVTAIRGERVAFYKIFAYYEALLKNKYTNIDAMIAEEFPKISRGLAGSAMHGAIHLGYGYSAGSDRIVLEGLTYIYHSYNTIVINEPTVCAFGEGNVEIVKALEMVAADTDLREAMIENMKQSEWSKNHLNVDLFQRRVMYLLSCEGDKLVNYACAVRLPEGVREISNTINASKLAKKVVVWAVTVYTLSEHVNDFFLVHGVTALWSILQLMPVLKNEDGLKVLQEFLTILLAAYVAQNSPKLNVPRYVETLSENEWSDLIAKTLAEDRDEHCYKMVQVCHEMARDLTDDAAIFVQAARTILSHPFSFTYED